MWQGNGDTYFHCHTKHTPDWFIQISGNKPNGKIYVGIGSQAYDPFAIWKSLSFSGRPIRIKYANQNGETIVSAAGFQTLDGQTLDIGSAEDFIVTFPSFKIGDNVVPELSAHMHWSNENYRVWWHSELM
jgi:hypothetical protein